MTRSWSFTPGKAGDVLFIVPRSGADRRKNTPVLIGYLFHCAAVGGYEIESPIVYATGLSPNYNLIVVYSKKLMLIRRINSP